LNVPKASIHWTGGNPKYTHNDERKLRGTVTNWFGELNATLTVTAKKKDIFENIKMLKLQLDEKMRAKREQEHEYRKLIESDNAKKEELNRLEAQHNVKLNTPSYL
jgi:Spy/CpxP family protein refolding chaperone